MQLQFAVLAGSTYSTSSKAIRPADAGPRLSGKQSLQCRAGSLTASGNVDEEELLVYIRI